MCAYVYMLMSMYRYVHVHVYTGTYGKCTAPPPSEGALGAAGERHRRDPGACQCRPGILVSRGWRCLKNYLDQLEVCLGCTIILP